ncbi:unnamed protein product [Psylliodes chrysocephalus]|uniref:C2H2-type domain-containing protein n=1 Tax=Psylliodes chrysocephalus TaxID=3402493 RepID=A0A9P0CQ73_9CUCU|nr:unnamed protein product [Psylliodes chrysocephala]
MNTNIANPEEWGSKKVEDQLQPIICEMSPAPELLLNTIRCTCKTDTNEPCGSDRCTCRQYGVNGHHKCVCGKEYMYAYNLKKHQAVECQERTPYECKLCNYKTNILGNLRIHYKSLKHLSLQFRHECEDCGKSYKNKKDLNKHQRLECGKEPSFTCVACCYKTTRIENLNSHNRSQKHLRNIQYLKK